jgi:polyribonucleotide nucleotidyltransferase
MQIIDVIEATLPAPRAEVAATAPRILTIQIPMDKIGEIIGPKGKNINAMQLDTGCDISVDDDGTVGRVVIGSRDGEMVKEVQRRIELILNPPEAKLGAVYLGKVVGITKFGAFVNILPGRDGLVHISKLGRGKRVERVEDVLELNQEISVKVDEIDPAGKLALSIVGDDVSGSEAAGPDRGADSGRREAPAAPEPSNRVSFEDSFESELAREIGDLG